MFENRANYLSKHGDYIFYESDNVKEGELKYMCHCEEFKVRKQEILSYVFSFERIFPLVPFKTIKTTNFSNSYHSGKENQTLISGASNGSKKKRHIKNFFEFGLDPLTGKIMGGDKITEIIKKEQEELKLKQEMNDIYKSREIQSSLEDHEIEEGDLNIASLKKPHEVNLNVDNGLILISKQKKKLVEGRLYKIYK